MHPTPSDSWASGSWTLQTRSHQEVRPRVTVLTPEKPTALVLDLLFLRCDLDKLLFSLASPLLAVWQGAACKAVRLHGAR